MTDQELQSLRNMGNECEAAADEIARLRAENAMLAANASRLQRLLDAVHQIAGELARPSGI